MIHRVLLIAPLLLVGCGDSGTKATLPDASGPIEPPAASCEAEAGSQVVAAPTLLATIADRWHEGWLASPSVADLDSDGVVEIVLARSGRLSVWHADESDRDRKASARPAAH